MMDEHSNDDSPAFWCVVPAAGIGSRMGLDIPKQYLKLHGKTVLEHTLEKLLAVPLLQRVVLPIHAEDVYWSELQLSENSRIHSIQGGNERCHSVLAALAYLKTIASDDDWVLVHDAARPCITLDAILKLIGVLKVSQIGGILGVPVSDTLKMTYENTRIVETVDRRHLWQAQTPQMFRLGLLHSCLKRSIEEKYLVTDEASAVEYCNFQPLIVEGRSDNIKITRPDDLPLVEFILNQQMLHHHELF